MTISLTIAANCVRVSCHTNLQENITTYMIMIHMQFGTFYLIFVQRQPLDACSSSAGPRLFSFVPESSNRILKNGEKKKKGDNQSQKTTRCL